MSRAPTIRIQNEPHPLCEIQNKWEPHIVWNTKQPLPDGKTALISNNDL